MVKQMIVLLFLIGIGILFSLGKGVFLITGYNTIFKKEKKKYDAVSLCKSVGKWIFAITGCVIIPSGEEYFPGYHLFVIGKMLLIAVFVLIYMKTWNPLRIDRES